MTLSDTRKKANKKWDEKNKERKQYINKRSVTKNFILKFATEDDLVEILKYVSTRKKELNKKETN